MRRAFLTLGLLVFVACASPGSDGSGRDSITDTGPTALTATVGPEANPSRAAELAPAPPLDPRIPRPPETAKPSRVLRVIDGDTVVLGGLGVGAVDRQTGGHRARLIGVDTPEVHGASDCYGNEASAFTKRELDHRQVLVDFDVQATDRYGRVLVYIWTIDGGFFNARLVAEGYAQQMTIPPNVRYAALFSELAREAREANRGLWSACDAPA